MSTDQDQDHHHLSSQDLEPGRQEPDRSLLDEKRIHQIIEASRSSTASSGLTIATPRTTRFAEATSVNSPIGPLHTSRNPFADPTPDTRYLMPQPQPSDVGFGYMADAHASKHSSYAGIEVPITPASPLRSALKVPGTPGRNLNPLSPTFREEQILEKHEEETEKANAQDVKIKTRVRMAKMALRGTNFSCSLIVLSMLSATFTIFNSTRDLPKRANLPPWANNQQTWPQITLLSIACVSLAFSLGVFVAYYRGGHKRAEKAAVYYTVFAIAFFFFNVVMWAIGAAILNESRKHGKGNDMWGWSCKNGKRKDIFAEDVDYALICRLQHWSLICAFIEIIVEVITISIYAVVFYRYYSKRRLHKSMDVRDKARSDLYLAQLRTQSAPNTPGFQKTPMTATFPSDIRDDPVHDAENGESVQFASQHQSFSQPKPFQLQAPPIRIHHATPALSQDEFAPAPPPVSVLTPQVNEHVPAAPGEQSYDAVPIPGSYASPLTSPTFQPQGLGHTAPVQAHTAETRIEGLSGPQMVQHTLH